MQRAPTARLPTGTVTFMFTDIEGSTRLSAELGDDFSTVIDRHHEIMREALAACDGVVVSTDGDAFFAVFVDPTAAVTGTVTAQRALIAETWPSDREVRVRMGLHTGEGRLGGDDYAGLDVNRAARVASAAHGGQVLISGATATALDGRLPLGASLRSMGEVLLKDLDAPVPVFQVNSDGLPADFPPLRAERPGWLPQSLTSFLGREPEITAISSGLEQSRLVTLTGPGGTGKTRLSIEVARRTRVRFPGGAWFVPLDAIHDPALVLPEIADRLDVRDDGQQSVRDSLAAHVSDKPTLLVLDNLEQVVGVGPELAALLGSASGLHVLASSREALRVSGEQEYAVPTMDVALAVELFVKRAQQIRAGFESSPELEPDIREIVERLDRLPLAIELAAARIRLFPPHKLKERLASRLDTLSAGARDLPERQRTMRGAIEWSVDLLDGPERGVFDRLAVFAGGADFTAVDAVIDPDRTSDVEVLEAVSSLAEKSLIAIVAGPGDEPRITMLETIRECAAERLAQSDDAASTSERHADHYLAFAEEIEPMLLGARPAEALARVEAEHDNLRAVLDLAASSDEPARGLRVGGAIWRFWQQRAFLSEGRERLEALLAHPSVDADQCAKARGATGLGGLVYWQGDYGAARDAYEVALDAYRTCGDEPGIARALYDLAFPTAYLGDGETAARLNDESLGRFTALGDQQGATLVKESIAVMALIGGDYETARAVQTEVADIRRTEESIFKRIDSIGLLAIIEALLGDAVAAREHSDEASSYFKETQDVSGFAGGLQTQALVALAEGRPKVAAFCCGVLQGMRDRGAKVLVPSEALSFPDPELTARERLGEAFEVPFEQGRRTEPLDAFERIDVERGMEA